jgi:hypothetical protein
MSYYTLLELAWDDSDYFKGNVSAEEIVAAAAPYVERSGWHPGVLNDLRAAMHGFGSSTPGFNRIPGFALVDMLRHISKSLPDVTFFARGIGEEFGDIWLRRFRDGELLASIGPFIDED